MSEAATASTEGAAWTTWSELIAVVTLPRHLKRTVTISLIVGTVFVVMNQLGPILAGDATPIVWVKAALTYLTPLFVSNVGILSATRRSDSARKG